MKLSIIVNFNFNEVCNLQSFSNLHALKITWSEEGEHVVDTYGFELPPQLKKLQLISYPGDQNWPAWLKRHPTLEILHFSFFLTALHFCFPRRNTAFPDDLMLPKLQVLWLTKVSEFDKSIMELGMPRWFPSLRALFEGPNGDRIW
nr:uncharacterized protein LOC109147017 [Ipomoea trifida]